MKHFKINLVICICLSLFFFQCSKKKENELEFWTLQLSPMFNEYIEKKIKEYERIHPGIKIKWVDIPYDAAIQKLLSSAAAGSPPDIVNLSADYIPQFAQMKAFANPADYLNSSEINKFLPNALRAVSFKNQLCGLPWYLNTYALIYNKELIELAGFSEKDLPKNFYELANFVKKYKDKTGKYALAWTIGKDSFLPTALESEGMSMTDSNLTYALFNSPSSKEFFMLWIDLFKNGYISSDMVIKPASYMIETYMSGQAALILTGSVFLKRIKDNAPKIYEVTRIAPNIKGSTGKHDLAAMSLCVLNTCKRKKEAFEFVAFILSPESQLEFCKLAPVFPSTIETLKDDFFIKYDGTIESYARILCSKDLLSAEKLLAVKSHSRYFELKNIFEEAIQKACLKNESLDIALDEAALEWNKILPDN